MEVRNRQDIEFHGDVCGRVQTLYESDNLSWAYIIIESKAKSHKHKVMEEVYYITKGRGILRIGDEQRKVKPNDIIAIPKEEYHYLIRTSKDPLELMVVTYPRYDPFDVYEE